MKYLFVFLVLGSWSAASAVRAQTRASPDAGAGALGEPADAGAASPEDAAPPLDAFAQVDQPPETPRPGVEVNGSEDELFRVETVDVVATLGAAHSAPGAVVVIGEEELETFNFDDPTQVLTQVPGVYVRTEDGYGLRPNIGMRGADSDRSKKLTLMEDGVLFGPAPYSAPAAYYFPHVTRMVQMAVFKGAPALRYGPQTIGGGLNLRTRETPSEGPVAALDASLGNTLYNKAHGYAGHGATHWGVLAEGLSLYSQGFKQLDGGGDTGFAKQEFMLKGRLNSHPARRVYQRLELKLGYSHESSRATYLGLTDADFRANPFRRYRASQRDGMKWHRTQAELFHVLEVGRHFELKSAAYRHDHDLTWTRLDHLRTASPTGELGLFDLLRNPGGTHQPYVDLLRGTATSDEAGATLVLAGNHRTFVSQGVQTVGRVSFESGPLLHAVELGVRLHQDSIDRYHRTRLYEMQRSTPDADLTRMVYVGRDDPLADNDVSTRAVAAHAVYTLSLYDLTLSPGLRNETIRASYTEHGTDAQSHADDNVTLLALGARYQATDEVALLAGVQQGMTPVPPGPPALDGASGQTVKPERAVNYELGVRYADARGRMSLIGFVSDYERIITTCEACAAELQGQAFDGGRGLVYGLELGGDYDISLPGSFSMPLRLSYTYTHAEFRTAFQTDYPHWTADRRGSVEPGDQIPYIPPHQLSAGGGLSWKQRVGVDLQLTFIDRMREQAGQGRDGLFTDRVAMVDAVALYQALESLQIYVRGDNITNSQPIASRRPYGARSLKPLLVQVGAKWELD